MKSNIIGETIISIALIFLLIFYLHPLEPMMPKPMHTVMVPLVVILFIFLAAFFWRETPGDERQELHRLLVSRFAYFAGMLTLTIAIILQSMHRSVDSWLIITLCIMLLAKLIGSFYTKLNK